MADISDRIVRQVGLEHATFDIEYFWDKNIDALGVLEISSRHSQSHAELFAQVDGAPNHLALLRLVLGREPVAAPSGPLPGCGQVACATLARRCGSPPLH